GRRSPWRGRASASTSSAPAGSERMCCGLRSAVAGEDPLLVPVCTEGAARRSEVGEVPHLLAHHRGHSSEDAMAHLAERDLVLLGPRLSEDRAGPDKGVSAVFGDDQRFVEGARPPAEFVLQVFFSAL